MGFYLNAPSDYFIEVESFFSQLRGRDFRISPKDWQLLGDWEKVIPLHLVLGALKECFSRNGEINSLSYCAGAVEKKHQEWLKSQVGVEAEEKVYGCDQCFDTGVVMVKPDNAEYDWQLVESECSCRKNSS